MQSFLVLLLLLCHHVKSTWSNTHSPANQDHVLLKKLHEVAGVYVDETKRQGLEKTVVITSCNYGFLNHLHNFKCFAKRLGIRFLVMSMDAKLHNHLTQHTNMISYLLRAGVVGNVSSETHGWASRFYQQITAKKTEAVHAVLVHGYDLLFADVDMAIVRDPFPYLLYPGVQYVHSTNDLCRRSERLHTCTSLCSLNLNML
jgi:hypothetical protein